MKFSPLIVVALCAASSLVSPSIASAQAISLGVDVGVAPPPLPVYQQPPCPTPGYLWTPGYWGYGGGGYYWVPGVWVAPPQPNVLWTPGYWGFAGGFYSWHGGYWGAQVGYYGGINYGFGYSGVGFFGGQWIGGAFAYNTAFANVNRTVINNTYVNNNVTVNNYNNHSSFSGPGGVTPNSGFNPGGPERPLPGSGTNPGGPVQPVQPSSGGVTNPGGPERPLPGSGTNPGGPVQPVQPSSGGVTNPGGPVQPVQPSSGGVTDPGGSEHPVQPSSGGVTDPGGPEHPVQPSSGGATNPDSESQHLPATAAQMSHQQAAGSNQEQYASYNHGTPQTTAMDSVRGRAFDQQGNVAGRAASDRLAPGGMQNRYANPSGARQYGSGMRNGQTMPRPYQRGQSFQRSGQGYRGNGAARPRAVRAQSHQSGGENRPRN